MNEVYRRSCGMDIHKDTVVVCILPPVGKPGEVCRKIYRTFRNDLIRLRVWLKQLKVTEIAMESTGVYWRPVWNVLEGQGFRLLLVNPHAPIRFTLQGPWSDYSDRINPARTRSRKLVATTRGLGHIQVNYRRLEVLTA